MSTKSNTPRSADGYVLEPLLWSLFPAGIPTVLWNLLSSMLPRITFQFPFMGPLAVVLGLAGGLLWLLVSLNIGVMIAARRRGLPRGEYWETHRQAKQVERHRRSRRKVRDAARTIEEEVEDAGYEGTVVISGGEINIQIQEREQE